MPIKQKVPVEEKVRIIRKYLSGEISLTEGAKEARVSFESIKSWVNIYENHGVEGFHRNRNNEYSAEIKTEAVLDYETEYVPCSQVHRQRTDGRLLGHPETGTVLRQTLY